MSNVNVELDPARVGVDLLWPPQLTIDLFAQQWARFCQPTDFDFGVQTFGAIEPEFVDWFTIIVCYPDAWDVDPTFDERMRLRLEVTFEGGFAADPGTPWPDVRFQPASNADTVDLPMESLTLLRKDYHRELPVGPTVEMVQIRHPIPGLATATRHWGAIGPDCCYRFVIVDS